MQRRKLNQIASVLKRKSNSSIRGLISTNKYLIKFNNLSIPDGQFNQKKKISSQRFTNDANFTIKSLFFPKENKSFYSRSKYFNRLLINRIEPQFDNEKKKKSTLCNFDRKISKNKKQKKKKKNPNFLKRSCNSTI